MIRIIPTRVGKSVRARLGSVGFSDHPHACGEKGSRAELYLGIDGSSPRVWGKDNHDPVLRPDARIIPTRVGKRPASPPRSTPSPDHPHACGEKIKNRSMKASGNGSSPRVWGKATLYGGNRAKSRIIPTRVGKRPTRRPQAGARPDHPHACGEKVAACADGRR